MRTARAWWTVTITDEGRRRLAEVERTVPAYLDEAFAPLSAGERAQLTALLVKLMELDPAPGE